MSETGSSPDIQPTPEIAGNQEDKLTLSERTLEFFGKHMEKHQWQTTVGAIGTGSGIGNAFSSGDARIALIMSGLGIVAGTLMDRSERKTIEKRAARMEAAHQRGEERRKAAANQVSTEETNQ